MTRDLSVAAHVLSRDLPPSHIGQAVNQELLKQMKCQDGGVSNLDFHVRILGG